MTQAISRQTRPSRVARMLRGLARAPWAAKLGLLVTVLYALVAIFAPAIAPFSETEVVSPQPFMPWGDEFLLGTDQLGRDLFSRLIYGARNTIGISLLATAISFGLGAGLGILAAALGGWLDMVLARLVDALMAIPQLIAVLILLSIFGSSTGNLIVFVGLLGASPVFRLARSVAMNVVVMEFVEDARLRGERLWWILTREILPNILPTLIAEFGMRFCFVVLTVSALSFLGLGLQPPTADWGSMVRENATLISYGDITPLLPAAAIAGLAISVNFVVDWVLDTASGLTKGA